MRAPYQLGYQAGTLARSPDLDSNQEYDEHETYATPISERERAGLGEHLADEPKPYATL